MSKMGTLKLLGLGLLLALLVSCEGGYTASGVSSHSKQDLNGGKLEVRSKKASGSLTEDIEVNIDRVYTLEADVTLSVQKGIYKIELIGKNDQVTLVLEAGDGQTVSGHGWMAVDSFGDASYRVTAVEAEGVEYTIEYVFY